MRVNLKEIGQLFSPDSPWKMDKCSEKVNHVSLEFTLGECSVGNPSLDEEPDFSLNERDEISIGYFEGDDLVSEYFPNREQNWPNFIQELRNDASTDNARVVVDISKRFVSNRVSVYLYDEFTEFIKNKNFGDILSIFDNLLANHPYVIFEIQREQFDSWQTARFAFVKKDGEVELGGVRNGISQTSKSICTNNLQTNKLIPDDFKLSRNVEHEDLLQKIFSNCAQLLVICYLSDYGKVDGNKLEYKINGYRTICKNLELRSIDDEIIKTSTIDVYFQVYHWLYNGGNIFDKVAIVRNIVTLNVDEDTLLLKQTTFDSVQTNYNIYEKKNVEQYITLRNKVSEQLRNYQKEIIGIVDGFENDFKKMMFSFLTFVFTSVVIRCMAKNIDSKVLLPDSIIYCLLAFCTISFVYYFYAKWEVDEKIDLFDRRYNDTRNLYGEILSEKELDELFMDRKADEGGYQSFMLEREVKFRCVWIVGEVIVMILLIGMLWINHR